MALTTKDKHGVMMISGVAAVLLAFVVFKVANPPPPPAGADGCVA
jgi:hypothetical protein